MSEPITAAAARAFVPDGCEFYQYAERMHDVRDFVGAERNVLRTVLCKTLTVRRAIDGLFFSMSWTDDSVAQEEARCLAEDVRTVRVGGNRPDLGEVELGATVKYVGRMVERVAAREVHRFAIGDARSGIAVLIDDEAKEVTLDNGDRVPFSLLRAQ